MMKKYSYEQPFLLENGEFLPGVSISYYSYGILNPQKNNVIWICHALTANADVAAWWPGMVGPGLAFDTNKYFVVCANILGSCYGTTGPLSINDATNKEYFHSFPFITIRDMVQAHILLRKHLGIEQIYLLAGGSMGGYQAMEWSLIEKEVILQLFLLATSARESAWGIAIHTAQRLAIEADITWKENNREAGSAGLKAARAIGMLTYRNYGQFALQQEDNEVNKIDNFRSSSYIIYQSEKLVSRFNAYSYYTLTKAMDTHNIARHRFDNVEQALQCIVQKTLLLGITSDFLCPVNEQHFMANHLPDAVFVEIDSPYGHDGFLTETKKITAALQDFMN